MAVSNSAGGLVESYWYGAFGKLLETRDGNEAVLPAGGAIGNALGAFGMRNVVAAGATVGGLLWRVGKAFYDATTGRDLQHTTKDKKFHPAKTPPEYIEPKCPTDEQLDKALGEMAKEDEKAQELKKQQIKIASSPKTAGLPATPLPPIRYPYSNGRPGKVIRFPNLPNETPWYTPWEIFKTILKIGGRVGAFGMGLYGGELNVGAENDPEGGSDPNSDPNGGKGGKGEKEKKSCDTHPTLKLLPKCTNLVSQGWKYPSLNTAASEGLGMRKIKISKKAPSTKWPGGTHYNLRDGRLIGTIVGRPCCLDTPDGPKLVWRYRAF